MGETIGLLSIFVIIAVILGAIVKIAFENSIEEDDKILKKEEKFYSEHNISSAYRYQGSQRSSQIKYYIDEVGHAVYIEYHPAIFVTIPFSEIIGCEIIIDDHKTNAVGRAIVGSALAGETGAIVGAITATQKISSYKIAIYRNNLDRPITTIDLIHNETDLRSNDYKNAVLFASQIQATIKAIIYRNESNRRLY